MLGRKRLELMKERFAWLGRQLRLAELPPPPPGMARARDGQTPCAKKKPQAAQSLARPAWMPYNYSNSPTGEKMLARQPHWMTTLPRRKPGKKQRKSRSPVGQIARQLPPFKLPKLPNKYHWQA